MQEIKIKEVVSKKDFKIFLNLSKTIYKDNPTYVTPLNFHIKMMIGKIGTHKKHLFLAYDGETPVARVGIKVHKHDGTEYLHFGFFECLEGYQQAAKELIAHSHKLYPTLTMKGPYHFRMEDPYIGTLVDGFENAPYFLMTYNPKFYPSYLEEAGMEKAMDLITYAANGLADFPEVFHRKVKEAKSKGITIRWLNPKKMKDEVRTIAKIFNEALSNNWGFEELIDKQVKEMYILFKLFLNPKIVALAQKDGEDIGCLIMLPNYNPMIKKAKGKISPMLIFDFIFNKKNINTTRGYAMGVLKKAHGLGIGTSLMSAMRDRCVNELNMPICEISWILSNNDSMNAVAKHINGTPNKTYRIFEKPPLQS